jgi:hypothetical protein
VIGYLAALTPADLQAWCAANGSSPADCAAIIASQSVGGVFCDGDVSMALDAHGNKVTTCIPTGTIEAKTAAIKASCLADCGKGTEECVPYCGGGTAYAAPSASSGLLILGGLAALAGLGVWLLVR